MFWLVYYSRPDRCSRPYRESLLAPREYARLVALHGTTTVIADPHEIANVAGARGIDFMLAERAEACIDIRYLLPSCVPATPLDEGGATLDARALGQYIGHDGILGLGEMMNIPGVLAVDPAIGEKLRLFSLRDGHAPLLRGHDLNAYILAGMQSDHESTERDEAEEKLRRGLYLFIREGSTERNIADLIGLVTEKTVARCCFATDDCHADILFEKGHIDHCVRRAVQCGLEAELALRMATLSAAERFGLGDRGALTPGRRADFCVVDDLRQFIIKKVFVQGERGPTGVFPALHLPPVTLPLQGTFCGRTADQRQRRSPCYRACTPPDYHRIPAISCGIEGHSRCTSRYSEGGCLQPVPGQEMRYRTCPWFFSGAGGDCIQYFPRCTQHHRGWDERC